MKSCKSPVAVLEVATIQGQGSSSGGTIRVPLLLLGAQSCCLCLSSLAPEGKPWGDDNKYSNSGISKKPVPQSSLPEGSHLTSKVGYADLGPQDTSIHSFLSQLTRCEPLLRCWKLVNTPFFSSSLVVQLQALFLFIKRDSSKANVESS